MSEKPADTSSSQRAALPPQQSPYGAWVSPITSSSIAAATVGLRDVRVDGGDVYWVERRPQERREVVVRARGGGEPDDTLLPRDFYVRTLVHSYGGGAYSVCGGIVYASRFQDQRLYRCEPGCTPVPLTPEPQSANPAQATCYADGLIDQSRRLWIGVRQEPSGRTSAETNSIVAINLATGGAGGVLVSGSDFYSSPRLSLDGARLAWLSWNHPQMPWTGTELWVGDITADGIANAVRVSGGESESVFQPEWGASGALYFVSDRTNWWNLYRWESGTTTPLCNMPAEFGRAQWSFGMATYCPLDEARIACTYSQQGLGRLAVLDTRRGTLDALNVPETDFSSVNAADGKIFYIGGSPEIPAAVVMVDAASEERTIVRPSTTLDADIVPYLTSAQAVEFPTTGGKTSFGLYYPPRNPLYTAPQADKPPLLVKCHGGPTSAASSTLDLGIQFWTSRGIAVLDVNYGGSTGFGREYRGRLHSSWGLVDVDDSVNGARYLAERGLVDGDRSVISGGSSGGYTTLAALAFRDYFRAGASLYGISDLAALARHTHKFELHYTDWLIAPYDGGNGEAAYRARSPLYHLEQFRSPVVFFQGSDDPVVPPDQTASIVDALRSKGVPVSYFLFMGEGHGFRQPENIQASLDAQLWFFDLTVFQAGLATGQKKG